MTVFVLTNTELGWDCVIGVFQTEQGVLDYFNQDLGYEYKTIEETGEDGYVVHETTLCG